MEHLLAKAATVAEELGTFTAIASAWDADREDDTIARDAFDQTISAWQGSGKRLPLLWEHGSEVVGFVEPDEMHTDERGLIIAGEIDRETDRGKQAWKMIKSRVAGFSIGFASESRARKGGGRLITSIDLLEISVTPRPIHPATKPLPWKSASAAPTDLTEMSSELLRSYSQELARKALYGEPAGGATTLTAEDAALVEASRAEYLAEKAKAEAEEAEAEEDEAARRQRMVNLSLPRRAITFNGQRWRELPPDAELATDAQIQERNERLARQAAQARATEQARQKRLKETEPVICVLGLKVRARDGVIVEPPR